MMCAGELDERITIRPPTDDINELGGFTDSGNAGDVVWAKFEVFSESSAAGLGADTYEFEKLAERRLWRLTIRKKQVITGSVITDENSKTYVVRAAIDAQRRDRFTILVVQEEIPTSV